MQINLTHDTKKDGILSSIILIGMSEALVELVKTKRTPDGLVCDVKLLVEGDEVDLQPFLDHWQSQVKRLITKQARELAYEQFYGKFNDVIDMLEDLQGRVSKEVDKRLEDWERR